MNTNSVFYFFLFSVVPFASKTNLSQSFISTKDTHQIENWELQTMARCHKMVTCNNGQASFKTKVQLIFKQKQINVIIISKWRSDFLYSVTAHYSFQVRNHLIWLDHNHLITIFFVVFHLFYREEKRKKN